MTKRDPSTEWLMRHDVPRTSRRKIRRPLSIKPPRCDDCDKQPPACTCKTD